MKLHRVLGFCAFGLSALAVTLSAAASPAPSGDLEKAPPPFDYRGASAVPVDFDTVEVDYVFDVASRRATAHAVVTFDAGQQGYPMLDLVPNPTSIRFNGVALANNAMPVVSAPGGATSFRVLSELVGSDTRNTLEVDYALGSSAVTFTNGAARAGFFVSDLADSGREFFEQYGPASFEFDQVKYSFRVRVTGTQTRHEVFTNAAIASNEGNEWVLDFPDYFTTSSLYFHMSEVDRWHVQQYTYAGLRADIPVTVYSSSSSLTQSAVTRSRTVLAELESTYGPYAHEQVIIYMTATGGGMEYVGATVTSLYALEHEMTHFWFARGVMPSNGNSGWIDEAIASWRDDGYPRRGAPNRSPVNLGAFSPYRRHTPMAAYSEGARLIGELDYLFRDNGGMKPILRQLFTEKQRQTITVPMFQDFLEAKSGQDLDQIFARYVYGRASINGVEVTVPERMRTDAPWREQVGASKHPRPYTAEEIALYR